MSVTRKPTPNGDDWGIGKSQRVGKKDTERISFVGKVLAQVRKGFARMSLCERRVVPFERELSAKLSSKAESLRVKAYELDDMVSTASSTPISSQSCLPFSSASSSPIAKVRTHAWGDNLLEADCRATLEECQIPPEHHTNLLFLFSEVNNLIEVCSHGKDLKAMSAGEFSETLNEFEDLGDTINELTKNIRESARGLSPVKRDEVTTKVLQHLAGEVYKNIDDKLEKVADPEERKRLLLHTETTTAMLELGALFSEKLPFHNILHSTEVALSATRLSKHRDPSLSMYSGICHDIRMVYDLEKLYSRKAGMGESSDTPGSEGMSFNRAVEKLEASPIGNLLKESDKRFIRDSINKTVPLPGMSGGPRNQFTVSNGAVASESDTSAVALADLGASNRDGGEVGWVQETAALWTEMDLPREPGNGPPFNTGVPSNMEKARLIKQHMDNPEASSIDDETFNQYVGSYVAFASSQVSFGRGRLDKMEAYRDALQSRVDAMPENSEDKILLEQDLAAFKVEYCEEDGSIKESGLNGIKKVNSNYNKASLAKEGGHRNIAEHFLGLIEDRSGGEINTAADQERFARRNLNDTVIVSR